MSDDDLVPAALWRTFVACERATNMHRTAAEYWLDKGRSDRAQQARLAADETAHRADQARSRLEELAARHPAEVEVHHAETRHFATASGF